MFYALCLALCLAVMFLVLAVLVLASAPLARVMHWLARVVRPRTAANLLLAFRLAPLALAMIVSAGLALPSFLEFEPRATKEMINWPLLFLAGLGMGALLVIGFRLARVLLTTGRIQREWRRRSAQPVMATGLPLYCLEDAGSLLAVTGIIRPKVFVSRDVVQALTADELSAALAHELAHVRSGDNLKQILLKISRPPRWLAALRGVEKAWTGATEVAADEGALEQGASALELSSALIKVGRLSLGQAVVEPLAASHLAPGGCSSSTLARAAHLHELLESGEPQAPVHRVSGGGRKLAVIIVLFFLGYVACLATLLPAVHEALEFLVR